MPYIVNIIVLGLVIAATLWLVYFYASKTTTYFTIVVTFFGWVMGFLIIALLPLDIFVVLL